MAASGFAVDLARPPCFHVLVRAMLWRALPLLFAWSGVTAADPRFAPRQSWSFALPAHAPPPMTSPTRDQMIEDVAYLAHVIEEAWAWSSRSTSDTARGLRGRLEKVALEADDAPALCGALARELRHTGIELDLGRPCAPSAAPHSAVGALDVVPARGNFHWRVDRARGNGVGILSISRFADPQDAGWAGLGAALLELSTADLVIVDLQQARGADPRVGFAVLMALGLEDYERAYLRPPMFRDGPIAVIARENARATGRATMEPRARTLWSSFATGGDLRRIAREVAPGVSRTARPLVPPRVLVGPECGRACQLIVRLARWQAMELLGSFEDRSGDEPGVVRLPRSGITVIFPTAAYGPCILGGPDPRPLPPDYAKTVLAGLHAIGAARAQALAWHQRPVPNCAKLPIDRSLVRRRTSGCLPEPLPAKLGVGLTLSVDAATAARFLKTCDLSVGTPMDLDHGTRSTVSVSGTPEALSQALAAPFAIHASWGCEPRPH